MADFRSRTLIVLDKLYDFVAQNTAPTRFDLAGRIQPVHDVSRAMELGTGTFFQINLTQTHAVADTQTNQASLAENIPAGYDLTVDEAWLIDAYATSDTANLANCVLGFSRGIVSPLALGGEWFQTHKWDSAPYTLVVPNVPLVYSVGSDKMMRLPMWLGPQGTGGVLMNCRSTSTGALSISVSAILWIGPRGTSPPGMS